MGFSITTVDVKAGDLQGTAYVLADDAGTARAEVWPTHGFNCLRWQVRTPGGAWDDLLYRAPDWESNPVPTRSGHPVLFPFPNRMRAGTFAFEGKTYQLPLNESSGKHAIHGFTPRVPWRVVALGVTDADAFLTGEFLLSKDAPHAVGCWPADACLRLTYRLTPTALRVEAAVDAADGKALPFGLGYHPYFRAPGGGEGVADWTLTAAAAETWDAQDGLPTGQKSAVAAQFDFRTGRSVGSTQLDTAYSTLSPRDGVIARLAAAGQGYSLAVAVDPAFRELLLFTPPHRNAVAIEPYTCATDAMNLESSGVDAGWRVLPPGEVFTAAVEYRLEPRTVAGS